MNNRCSCKNVFILVMTSLWLLPSCDSQDEELQIILQPNYPVAEYCPASIVLTCSPGEEFNFAGSSQDELMAEYYALASILKNNGIQVYDVRDYDSPSDEGFRNLFSFRDMHSMVYVRDPIVATARGIVVGKMKNPVRSKEPDLMVRRLHALAITPIYQLQGENACLEGGDFLPCGSTCFIGCGIRTNKEAINELMQADAFGVDTVVVVNDKGSNPREMHLDTYFNIIDRDLMTLTWNRYDAKPDDEDFLSVDVYVRPSGSQPYVLTISHQPLLGFLHAHGISVIRIDEVDSLLLGGNYLCIGPRHIIASESLTSAFYDAMSENSVKVERIPTTNLRTGKGGIHCATQVISRAGRNKDSIF